MPALPVSLMAPLWAQFAALLPTHPDVDPTHPMSCHRRRTPDQVVFAHVIAAQVFGVGYERIASPGYSARTIRRRVHAWGDAGLTEHLHTLALAQYDCLIGLDLRAAFQDFRWPTRSTTSRLRRASCRALLQAKLGERGLRLSALYGGGRFSHPARAQEVITYNVRVAQFLAAMGVDRIVFEPRGPRNGTTDLAGLRQMAKTMNESAKRTADLGVVACVHPHLGTEFQDRDELDAVMEVTDPEFVHFCPDTAHLAAAGMDPAEIIRTYGSRMRYMHLKDLTPENPDPVVFASREGNEQLPIFCELGLGTLDFAPVMAALAEIGYDGWLTVEIDKSTGTPYESLRQCHEFLTGQLELTPCNAHRRCESRGGHNILTTRVIDCGPGPPQWVSESWVEPILACHLSP